MRYLVLLVAGILSAGLMVARGQALRGTVIDSVTSEPLAFATLALGDRRSGTTTDIDGRFHLTLARDYAGKILISHVGYQTRAVPVSHLRVMTTIRLQPAAQQLGEVVIRANANPAWRIIRKATNAKESHRPDRLETYAYKSYTKVIFKLDGPPVVADSLRKQNENQKLTANDSLSLSADSLRKKQHILVTESVGEKFYVRPNKKTERLLDYKVSGFNTALLAALPNDYQPLGFYDDWIVLLGKAHLSPLTPASEKVYDFTLTDTTFFEGDSVFTVTFTPLGNANFGQLEGQLAISRNGWAIKHVIARSVDPFAKIDFRIQQNYEQKNGYWFPLQLNTNLYFKENRVGTLYIAADARSYLQDVRINVPVDRSVFGDVQVDLGSSRDTTLLSQYRAEAPDSLEKRTYQWLDSVAGKFKFFGVIDRLADGLFAGVYPTGKIDWQLNRVLRLNRFEGVRLGAGWRTNDSFSQWVSFGAFGGYGFRDRQWKWGGDLMFQLLRRRDWTLQVAYFQDLFEPGVSQFFDGYRSLSTYSFRQLVASRFDRVEELRIRTSWKPTASWRVRAGFNYQYVTPQFDYAFVHNNEPFTSFRITEATGEITYIHRLREMRLGGRKALVGFEQPLFTALVSRGIGGVWDSPFSYMRYEAFFTDTWRHRRLGTTQISLVGGYLSGVAPLQKQFFGPGNRETGIWVTYTFQTMGIYEFVSDQYTAGFLKHNFGWLYQTRYSRPELILWQGAGWGRFGNRNNRDGHRFIAAHDFAKGYFESGIGANNLLRMNYVNVAFLGLGFGAFYRWGHYALPTVRQNMRFQLDLSLSF